MKRKDIEKALRKYGWWSIGGTKHEKWTNGEQLTILGRHREINEYTARSIIALAKANPAKKKERK